MIRIYRDGQISEKEILARNAPASSPAIEAAAAEIIADVRARGDAALLDYTEKFDGVRPASLRMSGGEIAAAAQSIPEELAAALQKAAENIAEYHKMQRREGFELRREGGSFIGQRIIPLARAGIYVPGGTARYPSTVLMDAIPAKIAGVDEIVMVTPPARDGRISPAVLAAAKLAGVTEIYAVGGAQAIAALAYGTESIRPVDKIVGPGNAYVAAAKRQVFGQVSIDMIAGPSEILIIADDTAVPELAAADLLSQAEHDRLAGAVLVCTSEEFAQEVSAELERQLALLPRAEIARASIDANGKIIVVSDADRAAAIADLIAPEHLELCVREPRKLLEKVRNAGSVFLGNFSPEPLGDYMAGPNHTLPTMGTARFSSPLGVDDFIKRSSYICYTKQALCGLKDDITVLAEAEGLTAHAESVKRRFAEGK